MYQGRDGFFWFTGIVEDRNDPLFLNRVRVRIFGAHSYDKQKIATPDLPWCEVMMPVTSPSLSGLGTTTHGLVEGSFVMGFFRAAAENQDPIVMGSVVGAPGKFSRVDETIDDRGTRNYTKVDRSTTDGFNDPRLDSESSYKGTPDGPNPDHIQRNYGLSLALDKSPRRDGESKGVSYPKESYYDTSSVNLLARAEGKYDKESYPNNMIEAGGVGKTLFRGDWGVKSDNEKRKNWVKPIYPFNHVYESESGHVIEIDDTPDYERINVFHKSGSRIEINNKGEIHIIAAEGQDINLQGANVNIRNTGSGTLRIKADAKIDMIATKAAKILSQGPTDIVSSGETKITSLKDVIMKAVSKIKIQ